MKPSSASGWRVLAVVGLAALCGLLIAVPQTRNAAQRLLDSCLEGTGLVGHNHRVAQLRQGAGDDLVAPDFALPDAAGATIRLSGLRGKVVLLNFWATWCGPCALEMPWFMQFQERYRGQGLAVVGVSLDADGWDAVRPYLAKQGVTYPVVVGDGALARAYGNVESLPTTFVIGRDGHIRTAHWGLVRKDDFEAELRTILAER